MEASEEASAAFGHLGDLLSAFDDDDYDNILGDEDARSRADSSPGKAKKARKAQQLPDKFGLVYKRGVDLYLNGDHEEALEVFLEISHGVKNYAPLYNQMADCYQCLGRIEEAFESCKKAVNIDVQYLEAWARYVELAELMDSEELVHGLKKYIRLNLEKGDTSVLQHIRRLIELLETDKSSSAIKFKKLLFHLQYQAGNREECFLLGHSIARSYLSAQKVDLAIGCLEPIISSALESHEAPPENLILVYVESVLEKKQNEAAFRALHGFGMMQLTAPSSSEEVRVDTVEDVLMSEEVSLPVVAACCIVMTEFDNYQSVQKLLQMRILAVDRYPNSTLFLSLAESLIDKNEKSVAREILDRLYLQVEFHTPEFYFRLGKMYENQENIKQALDAYNRAVSLKPGFRDARWRIRRLGLPVPKAANLGTLEERQQTILIQRRIYEDYLVAVDQKDDAEVLRLTVDLVSSTFAHLDEVDYKDLVFSMWSPLRMEVPLQGILLYAPSIATNDVPLEKFWSVLMHGCALAFRLKHYDDLFELACCGLRTADFKPSPEKCRELRWAVVVAAFYMRRFQFSLRYLRDGLTASRQANLSVTDWNFFYQMVADGGVGQILTKWAFRWISLYGYSREILMISANDSMRRCNYRHSFELYNVILKKEGIENVPWYVLLHVGILYVNFACVVHCGRRLMLYTTGMIFLEKYGARRGHCPEVLYNKALAAHQFEDLSEAMHLYEECVELCDRTVIHTATGDRNVLDFKFPALYNLRALYLRNRNFQCLNHLYKKQLTWKAIRSVMSKGS